MKHNLFLFRERLDGLTILKTFRPAVLTCLCTNTDNVISGFKLSLKKYICFLVQNTI